MSHGTQPQHGTRQEGTKRGGLQSGRTVGGQRRDPVRSDCQFVHNRHELLLLELVWGELHKKEKAVHRFGDNVRSRLQVLGMSINKAESFVPT